MKKFLGLAVLAIIITIGIGTIVEAKQPLYLAYPPNNHKTSSSQIFLVGTANPDANVLINGQPIQRSNAGHFAPSFRLKKGDNFFVIRYKNKQIQLKVIRVADLPEIPTKAEFAPDSLTPAEDIARLPGELICFSAIAPKDATVSLELGNQNITLLPQSEKVELPANSALLTENNQPVSLTTTEYQGCTTISEPTNLGYPEFQLNLNGETINQKGTGNIEILAPSQLKVIEVTAESGITRTGPSTDYSRLTPLPQGTEAAVTGSEGEWLRLDYGAWIKKEETKLLPDNVPPQSIIRSITSRQVKDTTEVIFPLEVPIPVSVKEGEKTLTLTLYNTVAQTENILFDNDPIVKRLDWQQVTPNEVEYVFNLKTNQQWGYDLRYEGTTLIFSIKHRPLPKKLSLNSLDGIKILLDPGHGGKEPGSAGPTGYLEKDINLKMSKLVQKQLEKKGAIVYLTREGDQYLSLQDRFDIIKNIQPAVSISIHYNALPDGGDALNTKGVGAFWYHPQAHDLSLFLHNYLTQNLDRSSYGVFWNNLALTRPAVAPSLLLELGFMINPYEFEWITNPREQRKLATAIANGLNEWFQLALQ